MKGEGVVHALRHVHELIVPGGTLVDIHPVTEEEVEGIGVIREPEWLTIDLPNSEAAVRQATAEELYELEAEADYDVLCHFDQADELIELRSDLLENQQMLVDAIRAAPVPLVTRTHVVLCRLRAV